MFLQNLSNYKHESLSLLRIKTLSHFESKRGVISHFYMDMHASDSTAYFLANNLSTHGVLNCMEKEHAKNEICSGFTSSLEVG